LEGVLSSQRLIAHFIQLYKALCWRNAADTEGAHTANSLIAKSASDTSKSKEVTMKSTFKVLAIAGLLASAGFTASAQPMGQGATGMPMMGASSPMQPGGKMGMRGSRDPAKMEAMVAKRHAELKAKLKLTGEQETAWTTFTAAMTPPQINPKRPNRAEMDKLSTPERIDRMRALRAEHMTAMNAAMDKREDATKTFYAALNADQKKVFDAEHARMGGRHGEHRGPWGRQGAEKPAAK
jgi:hypothetical protein